MERNGSYRGSMTSAAKPRKRARGEIEALPSGSFRVRVYAGLDPLTKKRHYLTEIIPAGPKAAKQAEKVRTRLLSEVDEQRSARTNATVSQLLDRYLEVLKIEDTTRAGYERLIRLHIRPVLGTLSSAGSTARPSTRSTPSCGAAAPTAAAAPPSSTAPRRARVRRALRAAPVPAARRASLRQIHNILNGAFTRAVKWRWVGINPVKQAQPPTPPTPDPQPPTPAQAARIAAEAWRDPDWGMFVWLAMTTGARRGELCALRWNRIDFAAGVLAIRASIAQIGGRTWEKDTKTHQRRRIVLDAQTLALLRAYLQHCAERAAALGVELRDERSCSRRRRTGAAGRSRTPRPSATADVRAARVGHAPPPAPPLLGDRADRGRRRRPYRRRATWPRRRRDDDAARLQRVGVGGRSASSQVARRPHAGATGPARPRPREARCKLWRLTTSPPQPVRAHRRRPPSGHPVRSAPRG